MGNNEIGQITYYVQYILIVTLIMTNFSETIVLIKETINNLVRFYKLSITNIISTYDDNSEILLQRQLYSQFCYL